jgi:hypothetical protein
MEPRFLRTGGKRVSDIIANRRWDRKREFGPLAFYYKRVSTIYWQLRSVTAVPSKTRGSEYSMTKRAHILSRRIPGHHAV